MATIQNTAGYGYMLSPVKTYDITSTTAERIGPFVYYFSFGTDGRMFVLHTLGDRITGWAQFDGNIEVQTAVTDLALQPYLDNLHGRNPSSTRAMNYFLGGDDLMTGSKARDELMGLGGNDTLNGAGGRDHLVGGAGMDVLTGGVGLDVLTGGADADHFVFKAVAEGGDKITDFAHGLDHIDLLASAFGLGGALVDGVSFITDGVMSGTAPVLLYDVASGVLSYDSDGVGGAAAVVLATLTNHASLTASDVLLV